jgi:hypothetical protein
MSPSHQQGGRRLAERRVAGSNNGLFLYIGTTNILTDVVQNAFSKRLRTLGFDMFSMLVVDFMHEFEIGVWKSIFIHLIRILHSVGSSAIHELDLR